MASVAAVAGLLSVLFTAGACRTQEVTFVNICDVSVDRTKIAVDQFLGFGCEWDPQFWHDFNRKAGVTDQDWALVQNRVAFMRLPVVRMMMQLRWCYRGDGQFDWDNTEMMSLYAHLDVCQRQGITVILTDWGVESWAKAPGIKDTADPAYAEAIGTYLVELCRARGYTCVRYFILVNEPNFEVKDYDRWARGLRNVAAVFKKQGLDKQVRLLGPDAAQGEMTWFAPTVERLHDVLAGYDVHMYADDKMVRPGDLEVFFDDRWSYVRRHDPACAKLFIVGEAGMGDDAEHPRGNRSIGSHQYGLFMADYAVQATRAGSQAVCAWMLDDTNHEGFYWGLWSDKKTGFKLRPWFFVWSLLCRNFPAGSTLYRVDGPNSMIRVLAGRTAVGGHGAATRSSPAAWQTLSRHDEAWSFCVVNRGDADVSMRLRVAEAGRNTFQCYYYREGGLSLDESGFPAPEKIEQVDLRDGLLLACPGKGVVIASSLGG